MRDDITAKWANETATNILNEKITKQISKILDGIESAVKQNEFKYTYFGELHSFAKKDIEGRGFKVEANANWHQQDGDSYSITW